MTMWKTIELGDLADFYSGGTPSKTNPAYWGADVPWITVRDMKAMFGSSTNLSLTTAGASTLRIMPERTVYILVRGMGLFKDLPLLYCDRPATFNQDVKALVAKQSIDPLFLAYSLQAKKNEILRLVDTAGHGTGRLDTDLLKSVSFLIPTKKAEQSKISAVLRTWDEAIEKKSRVLGIKTKLYSWLTETLLVAPTLKLHPTRKKSARPLSTCTNELTDRNSANALGRDRVMGVSNTSGLVPMREQTIGSDISRYKVLPPKAFAYNPMRINVGSIAMSRLDSSVLVSPDYVLFACKKDVLDPDYFDHLCNTHWWKQRINESGSGSVRHRIYYDDLAALRIVIPPFEKQRQIANCLNQARREIELIEAQIAALNKQKRGLMQKLLTGEWRVRA